MDNILDKYELQIKAEIQAVLNGDKTNTDLPMMAMDKLFSYFLDLGVDPIEGDDWEQNGWQVDFWQKIHYKGVAFYLTGSLYYGNWNFHHPEKY